MSVYDHGLAAIALGFNDGSFYSHGLTSPDAHLRKLVASVTNLHKGIYGFKKVMIVVPPDTPASTEHHDEVRYMAQLACVVYGHYKVSWVKCVDFNEIGYYRNTSDGVHPTVSMPRDIAAFIYHQLLSFAPDAL